MFIIDQWSEAGSLWVITNLIILGKKRINLITVKNQGIS